jgi:hypothetical protein
MPLQALFHASVTDERARPFPKPFPEASIEHELQTPG